MTRLLCLRIALATAVAACGARRDATPNAAPPVADAAVGPCAGLTLATVPLVGIYHADLKLDGYETAAAFRVDDAPGGPVVALGGSLATGVATVPLAVGPQLLSATAGTMTSGRSLAIDRLDADCTMHGTWSRCSQGACYAYALVARKVDRLDEPVAHGLTRVSEFAGNPGDEWTRAGLAVNVRVAGGVAYLSTYGDGLRIVDVHDPAHPVELGHVAPELASSGEIYNDVKLVDASGHRYALLASDLAGVVVIDVTTAAAPAIVAHFGTAPRVDQPTNVHSIFVDGGRAYLANIDLGLEIWDLADPVHATRLGGWAFPAAPATMPFAHDLYVSGPRAYVNYWDAGMAIVDVSTPSAPALVGDFAGYGQHTSHSSWVTQVGARKIAVHGDEQWDAHVHIVDVTEGSPEFGQSIGAWGTRPEVSVHNVMASGSRAYVAYYQDGVRVLDLSDPTHPTPIAWFDTWPGYDPRYGTSFYEGAIGIDVDLDAKLLYVADSVRGLIVLHVDV